MILLFFFYGLAFLVMGIVIFLIPKDNGPFAEAGDFWMISAFGFIHGLNEWVDLFILRGAPFNIGLLKAAGHFIAPLSFVFLFVFGLRTILSRFSGFRWFKFLWVIPLLIWAAAHFLSRNLALCAILARYSLGFCGPLLASLAILRAWQKKDKSKLPKIVSFGTFIIGISFFIYGILAGLVVPKADFFPASVINYASFVGIFGVPVQFFRMLCATILAVSFFLIAGVYYYKDGVPMLRGGIKRKTVSIIFAAAVSIIATDIFSDFYLGDQLLYGTVFKGHKQAIAMAARCVEKTINSEIKEFNLRLSETGWVDLIKEANLKHSAFDEAAREGHFKEMDRQWRILGAGSALVKEYLGSPAGIKLKRIAEEKVAAELFITDKYGALVAASGKPTDFYQADENWWQESFAAGKGKVFIGNIEFDDSSNAWVIPLALPVRDKNNELVGICKIGMSLAASFEVLWETAIEASGRIILFDRKSNAVFRSIDNLSEGTIISEKGLDELLREPEIIRGLIRGAKKIIVAHALVEKPQLSDSPVSLVVGLEADTSELFTPLYFYAAQVFGISLLMILFFIIFGFIFARAFTKPIVKLMEAVRKIAAGDLDYRVEIKTGDEIEELANSFNQMAGNLMDSMKIMQVHSDRLATSIIDLEKANKELKNKSSQLVETNERLSGIKKELEDKISELKQFNEIAIDREIKMRELKEKINDLEGK